MKPLRRMTVALAVGAIMVTAACGGGEGGGLSDAPKAQDQPAAPGGGGTKILKMIETPGGPLSFVAYGVQKGYFTEEGIDLQLTPNPGGGTSNVPALLNDEYDVSGLDLVSTLITAGRGLPIKIVAAGSSTSQEPEGDFSAVLVKADSPIQGPKDLAGKTIGVNALKNINEVAIKAELEKQGVDPNSAKLVELPFPEILAAVQRGDVDAGVVIEPFSTIGQAQGLRVVHRPWWGIKPGLQIGAMIMTDKQIAEDPKLVDAFARAVKKTADEIKANPQAFRAALPALIKLDPALAGKVNLIQWQGDTDPKSVEIIGESMKKYGLLERGVNLDYDKLIVH